MLATACNVPTIDFVGEYFFLNQHFNLCLIICSKVFKTHDSNDIGR